MLAYAGSLDMGWSNVLCAKNPRQSHLSRSCNKHQSCLRRLNRRCNGRRKRYVDGSMKGYYILYIYTYLIYGMNIYLPAILVSPGYEPFDPYPYWPEIYILNIFLLVFEIEVISLITWLKNIFWTCFEPGLYRSFLPPNLEPWFLPVFLSQRGHIAGPPAAVAVQRAMVRSWDLEFCLGTLAKKGPWF